MPTEEQTTESFYDQLVPFYHLIYPDWNASIHRQAEALHSIVAAHWGADSIRTVLDAACGIGTQSLGIAALGYQVTASDLSRQEVERARYEATLRSLSVTFAVADMREVDSVYAHQQFDLVIACDNSIPHLLSDDDIRQAFRAFYACTRPGGGCLITVRDYDAEERKGIQLKPVGVRKDDNSERKVIFQVWEFPDSESANPLIYDLSLYLITDSNNPNDSPCETRVLRSRYYAVGTQTLIRLMEEAGFEGVIRIDGLYYQLVLLGKKPL